VRGGRSHDRDRGLGRDAPRAVAVTGLWMLVLVGLAILVLLMALTTL
jgi:hypothetical protein